MIGAMELQLRREKARVNNVIMRKRKKKKMARGLEG